MSTEDKRNDTLEFLYDEVLSKGDENVDPETVKLIGILLDDKKHDEDREADSRQQKEEAKRAYINLGVESGVKVLQGVLWAAIFVAELSATRTFEIENVETSKAGQWLRGMFPKPKLA